MQKKLMFTTDAEQRFLYNVPTHAPRSTPTAPAPDQTSTPVWQAATSLPPKFQSPLTHTGSSDYWDTLMDTQLLDCLFEIDNQQQDCGEDGSGWIRGKWPRGDLSQGRGQGSTIATTETHAAGEITEFSYFF